MLGLELGENDGILRLFDPATSEWLLTTTERAENAEVRAENAEAKITQLLAELERLKSE